LARNDPEALARAVAEARPFLQFRVDRILGAGDLTTAEGRARAAESALNAVAVHPDDLVRDQYVMQLSDRCRLDATKLREKLEYLRAHPLAEPDVKPSRRPAAEQPPIRQGDPGELRDPDDGIEWDEPYPEVVTVTRAGPGLEALKLAVHRPEDVADRLQPVLFSDPLQRQAFVALLEHDDLHSAIEAATPPVALLLRRVTVEEPLTGDPELGDPVDSVIMVLLREAVRRALTDVEKEARGLDASWQAGAAETAQVRLGLAELGESDLARSAANRLVAWLTERENREA
jgi:DNA primase